MIESAVVNTLPLNSRRKDAVATRCEQDDQHKQPLCLLPQSEPTHYFLHFTATNENIWMQETGRKRKIKKMAYMVP
jgi:hypothetical protein